MFFVFHHHHHISLLILSTVYLSLHSLDHISLALAPNSASPALKTHLPKTPVQLNVSTALLGTPHMATGACLHAVHVLSVSIIIRMLALVTYATRDNIVVLMTTL